MIDLKLLRQVLLLASYYAESELGYAEEHCVNGLGALKKVTERNFQRDVSALLLATEKEIDVIATQATRLAGLEAENAELKAAIDRALQHIVGIGGPLNDSRLEYSKEQLRTFRQIYNDLRG